jgi:hypothetical protein
MVDVTKVFDAKAADAMASCAAAVAMRDNNNCCL